MATPPPPRLRGREEELQALGESFDQVASGHLTIVVVEGEAGIGKTRLLADALDDARGRGLHADPPRPRVRQARHLLAYPARRPGDPPPGARAARAPGIGQLADVSAVRPREGGEHDRTIGRTLLQATTLRSAVVVRRRAPDDPRRRRAGLGGPQPAGPQPPTARWWPFVGSTAIAVSLLGPNYLADGAAAVALITMHVVGFILIWGFARFGRQPSRTSQWGTGTTSAR
jgi:hypothetical protein